MNSSVSSPRLVGYCYMLDVDGLTFFVYLSVSGGTGESKGKRKQNVVPLQINEILEAPEEGFLVEGQEVGMMVIVGKVMDCEKATTKTTYKVNWTGEVFH